MFLATMKRILSIKIKKNYLLLTSTITLLMSLGCSDNKTESKTPRPHEDMEVILKDDTSKNLTINVSENLQDFPDTSDIHKSIDTLEYPRNGIPNVLLLESGTFHNNEVPENAEKLNWFGLFIKNGNYSLKQAHLAIKVVQDVVVDEEDEMSGWEVKTKEPDSSLILISGLDLLPSSRIKTFNLNKKELFPGDSIIFDYNNTIYTFYVTGNKKKVSEDWYEVTNYKLYLKEKNNGKEKSQLIRATGNFDDAYTSFIWIGDIDGDMKLDFIVDITKHYNNSRKALYLSTKANSEEVVKYVGEHSTVGC
jgi:hypothetical protein